jgi:hypothetical protein
MPRFHHPLVVAFLAPAILFPSASNAQTYQAWVSGHGSNGNDCSVSAPCRTFQYAHDIVAAGGEIDVLDPADYGPVTITKSVSIVNDGAGVATIVQPAAGMNAITIAAGAGDLVHLRGLSLNGLGVAANGISLTSGGELEVMNCVVRRFMSHGVDLQPTSSLSFSISDLIASQDANAAVNLRPAADMTGSIDGLKASYNVNGVQLAGDASAGSANIFVSVVRSVASSNNNGYAAFSAPGHANVRMTLSDSTGSSNGAGAYAGSGGQIAVSHSNLVGNGVAVYSSSTGGIQTEITSNLVFNGTIMSGPGNAQAYPQK